MQDGSYKGTKEEKTQYHAKYAAISRFEKHQYVDACKREIGCCAKCTILVIPGTEPGFTFDHIDETTKLIGKSTIAGEQGGVSGIARNKSRLSAMKPHLDAEMAKCQLLCENCHKRKTHNYCDAV
jgi:5-methylcytosine-specific restriction endonuclease McrA